MQIYIKFRHTGLAPTPTHTHPFLGYTVTCKTDSEILLWDFEMAARGTTIKDGPGDSAARAGKCLISTIVLRGQIHWVLIHALIFLTRSAWKKMFFVCVWCRSFLWKWVYQSNGVTWCLGLDNNSRLPPLVGERKRFLGSRNCCQCSDSTAPETHSPVLEAPLSIHPLPLFAPSDLHPHH